MNYNDEQFEALARFEGSFRSAIDSNYAPHPGYDAMKEIRGIYIAATGARNVPEDYGCSSCVIRILRKAGRLWLEDKQARIDAANDAAAAKTMTEPVEECGENTVPKPKKSTKKTSKK